MELTSTDLPLQPPGGRILYTCVDAADSFFAFGANTGSVYVFASESKKQLVVVSAASESIIQLRFSPSADLIAACVGRSVIVIRHNASSVRDGPAILVTTSPSEALLSTVSWDNASARVFTGSEDGLVSVVKVPGARSTIPDDVAIRTDSAVVQLDCRADTLLISSLTRVIAYNFAKRSSSAVGQQPRNGPFGVAWSEQYIYAARPNGRLWRAGAESLTVEATLQMPGAAFGCLQACGGWILSYGPKGLFIVDSAARTIVAFSKTPLLSAVLIPDTRVVCGITTQGPISFSLPGVPPPSPLSDASIPIKSISSTPVEISQTSSPVTQPSSFSTTPLATPVSTPLAAQEKVEVPGPVESATAPQPSVSESLGVSHALHDALFTASQVSSPSNDVGVDKSPLVSDVASYDIATQPEITLSLPEMVSTEEPSTIAASSDVTSPAIVPVSARAIQDGSPVQSDPHPESVSTSEETLAAIDTMEGDVQDHPVVEAEISVADAPPSTDADVHTSIGAEPILAVQQLEEPFPVQAGSPVSIHAADSPIEDVPAVKAQIEPNVSTERDVPSVALEICNETSAPSLETTGSSPSAVSRTHSRQPSLSSRKLESPASSPSVSSSIPVALTPPTRFKSQAKPLTPDQFLLADITESDSSFIVLSKTMVQSGFQGDHVQAWMDAVSEEHFRELPTGVPVALLAMVISRRMCTDEKAANLILCLGSGVRSRKLSALCAEQGLALATDACGGVGLLVDNSDNLGGTTAATLSVGDVRCLAHMYPAVAPATFQFAPVSIRAYYLSELLGDDRLEFLRNRTEIVDECIRAVCEFYTSSGSNDLLSHLLNMVESVSPYSFTFELFEQSLKTSKLWDILHALYITFEHVDRAVELAVMTQSSEYLLSALGLCCTSAQWSRALDCCSSNQALLAVAVDCLVGSTKGFAVDVILASVPAASALKSDLCFTVIKETEKCSSILRTRRSCLETADTQLWSRKVMSVPLSSSTDTQQRVGGDSWGADVPVARSLCVCGLSLFAPVGTSITVYDCGHAYHLRCSPENSCGVCATRRFSLL